MRVIVTISDPGRLALLVDVKTGASVAIPTRPQFFDGMIVGRPACRPFGVTWDRSHLYIANNRQLLQFDRELQYAGTLRTALQGNVHQASFNRGRIWIVSPWTNSLIGVLPNNYSESAVELDLIAATLSVYEERVGDEVNDRHHFNSLLWTDTNLFVAAHAFGMGSFVDVYSLEMSRVSRLNNIGGEVHGLAKVGDELYWLSSAQGEIRSNRGLMHAVSRLGYVRGFAVTWDYFVIGISQSVERSGRGSTDAWIQVIERVSGKLVSELPLEGSGAINDLRVLDHHDYAHGIAPFFA